MGLCDIGLLYERRRAGFERKICTLTHPVLQSFGCLSVLTFLFIKCVCCDFKVFFEKVLSISSVYVLCAAALWRNKGVYNLDLLS